MATKQMTFDDYQQLARRTQNTKELLEERREHSLFGMASEVGEIHAFFQKKHQGHYLDTNKLKSEVGDLLWFIAELCDSYAWNMSDVAMMNIEKLKKRYPEGFDAERSVHREEYEDGSEEG